MIPFATKTDLMAYQREAVAKILPSRVGALFMDMGTGKSRTAIELAHLRSMKIDRVIWCCPVSLKETVKTEIRKHTDCEDIYVFGPKTSCKTVDMAARWVVVGIESISSSSRVVLALNSMITENTMVIVDESTYIKGHDSARTLRITRMAERARYRLILTGTPLSQGVVDLFAQMKFLSPKILGYRSWYSFAANHIEYSEKFPGMIVRSLNVPYLAEKIKPYAYQVTKAECLDLPEKATEERYLALTGEQMEAYIQAKHEILEDVDMEDFDSISIFRLFTTLQSIVCGFWNRPRFRWQDLRKSRHGGVRQKQEYDLLTFPENRTGLLMDTIRGIPKDEKVIVWGNFRYSVEQIAKRLNEEYGVESVALYYGRLKEQVRNAEENKFRNHARFFVATQSAGGHGLTLNEARYVIFYANGFKYSERLQAEDRCHRIGQTRDVTYIDLWSNTGIDDRIAKALTKKGNALRDFRDEVEKIKKKGTKKRIKDLVMSL